MICKPILSQLKKDLTITDLKERGEVLVDQWSLCKEAAKDPYLM
jgi:hypothetical protein